MKTIISDTSPLIILAKAGLLDILRKQFYGTLSVAALSSLEHSSLSFETIVERLRNAGLYVDERVVRIVKNELSSKKIHE